MRQELDGLVGGVRLAYGAIGVVTTMWALATAQAVAVLNTVGVAGVATLVFGIGTWLSSSSESDYVRVRNTALAMTISGLVAALLMFFGRPMDDDEKRFGFLTFIGVANVVVYAAVLSLGLSHIKRRTEPAKKMCPECANEVLQAAKRCQYCQYRFDST